MHIAITIGFSLLLILPIGGLYFLGKILKTMPTELKQTLKSDKTPKLAKAFFIFILAFMYLLFIALACFLVYVLAMFIAISANYPQAFFPDFPLPSK